jgi:hypothetical protein
MKGRQKVDASFVVRLPRVSPRLPTRLLPALPLHSVSTPGPSLPPRRDGCDPLCHYAIHAPPSAFPRRLPQPHLARVPLDHLRPLHHRPRSIDVLDLPDRTVTAPNSLPHHCPTFAGAAAAIPMTGGSAIRQRIAIAHTRDRRIRLTSLATPAASPSSDKRANV